jgi:teichuronic acid biosynthesis glycosyltransferase TuaG
MNLINFQDSHPLISIVMPAFNAEKTLAFAIQSVLSQKYTNWELLLVDDASTDNTLGLAEFFVNSDSRIKLFSNKINQGVAKSRNLALEARHGKFVTFLDSDDLWLDSKLLTQIEAMTPEIFFSYMPYSLIDYSGKFIRNYLPPKITNYKQMLLGNALGTLTVMLDSDYLGKSRFPIRGHEDYALWLALLRKGNEAVRAGNERSYAQYRIHPSSLTSSKLRAAGWQWSIYRESEGLSIATTSALMVSYAYKAILKRI